MSCGWEQVGTAMSHFRRRAINSANYNNNNNLRLLELQTYRYNHTVNIQQAFTQDRMVQLRHGPCVIRGSHSYTHEPSIPLSVLPATGHHRSLAGRLLIAPTTKGWPVWVDLGGLLHAGIDVPHRELNQDMVTHLSTNRARRWLTSLIEARELTSPLETWHHRSESIRRIFHQAISLLMLLTTMPLDIVMVDWSLFWGFQRNLLTSASVHLIIFVAMFLRDQWRRKGGGRREHPPRAAQGRDLEGQNMEFSNLAPSDLV